MVSHSFRQLVSPYPIGIHLGTVYGTLAVVNPAGRSEIVPNSEGDLRTASAVFFAPDGTAHVGGVAVDSAGAYPDRVVRCVQREMGTDWSVSFESESSGPQTYSAVDITAKVLSKIKQDAERTLGVIEKAVLTVPAGFSDTARRATIEAAEGAGLEVLKIINESTAAALAYASSGRAAGTVLVYDFGGGTFDASVVRINSDKDIEVLCSNGEKKLGGHDLDLALAEHLSELFQSQEGVHLLRDGDASTRHMVTEEAKKTKRILSQMETRVGIPLEWKGNTTNVEVTRETFEELISTHIENTIMLVEMSLDEANCTVEDIDDVILVGGSTRVPTVQRALSAMFGRPPLKSINPEEAVALGAAVRAAFELGWRVVEIRSYVTNHSYGTACVEDIFGTGKLDARNDIIIPKGTKIPCSVTKRYETEFDGQTEFNCRVVQGEAEILDFVEMRKECVLQLPPGRKAGCEILVTFSCDANEIMSCQFKDVESGNVIEFALDMQDNQASLAVEESDDIASLEDLDFREPPQKQDDALPGSRDLPTGVIDDTGAFELGAVANHSYGWACLKELFATGKLEYLNEIVIPKGTKIPCSVTKRYETEFDGQTEFHLKLTQGEGEILDFVEIRKEGVIQLPPGRKAGCEILVTFSYDANEIMSCQVMDVESGTVVDVGLEMHDSHMPLVLEDRISPAGLNDLDLVETPQKLDDDLAGPEDLELV